jgi:VanZ family protein
MFTTFDAPQRTPRATGLTRALGLVFVCAVAVATLYPLAGWSPRGAGPFDFLFIGLPRFWTGFDLLSNLLAYLVLGLLLALGWFERVPFLRTTITVGLACCALSLSLEAMQSYLPQRVPSLLDWLANSAGGFAGAALGALLDRAAHHQNWPNSWQPDRWYEEGPTSGWVLLLLWLATQLVPQRHLFASGQLQPVVQALLDAVLGSSSPDLSHALSRLWGGPAPAAHGLAIEAAAVVCGVCVVGSLVFGLVHGSRRRIGVLAGVAMIAMGLRSIATQLVYGSDAPLAWLTPGAQGGLVVGIALLYALDTLGVQARALAGAICAVVGLLLVNLAPEDPYFESTLAGVQTGQLVNLHGLLRVVATIWPVLAIAWFSPRARRSSSGWL